MPQDRALLAAAVGLARQPTSLKADERVSFRRRPRSACSALSDSAASGSIAALTVETLQPQTADVSACKPTDTAANGSARIVVDEETIEQFFLQGVAAQSRASEHEQYPHFFAWINMQKNKHIRDNSSKQQPLQQFSTSRPQSSCSRHRAASAGKQAALLQADTQAACRPDTSGSVAFVPCRPASPCTNGNTRSNHRSRPFSATVGHTQQQDQGMASTTTRPSSAAAWILKRPSSPSSGGQQTSQQQGQSTAASNLVPGWLVERCASKPVMQEHRSKTAAVSCAEELDTNEHGDGTAAVTQPNSRPWGWFPDESGRDSSHITGTSRPPSPATTAGKLKQWQQQRIDQSQHAAQQLFQQLPLKRGTTVDRQTLQQLSLGLQCELQRLGPPVTLQLPSGTFAADQTAWNSTWSAQEQVAPELQVWDKLMAELCRQTHTACSQRGALLLTAVSRQRQLLHMALSACDDMYSRMQAAAGELHQVQQTMLALQTDLQSSQQHNMQLMAALEGKQSKLDALAQQIRQQQDKMRQGRFHLIAEEVEAAKKEIETRWMQLLDDQLSAARQQAAEHEAASRKEWQSEVLKVMSEVADDSVADSVMRRLCGDEVPGVGGAVKEGDVDSVSAEQ